MSRQFGFEIGEFYHVFNRGVEKRTIFSDQRDKDRFLRLLYLCNSEKQLQLSLVRTAVQSQRIFQIKRGKPLVHLGVYCLLNNHFHLLVREVREKGLSFFMQKLATAYTMYFNIRNQRTGSLFESRFRAKHIDTDEYLKYMFSYIHLNPAEHIEPTWKEDGIHDLEQVKHYVGNYRYSSLPDYLGYSREVSVILHRATFPKYFSSPHLIEKELINWLQYQNANV